MPSVVIGSHPRPLDFLELPGDSNVQLGLRISALVAEENTKCIFIKINDYMLPQLLRKKSLTCCEGR